MSIQGDPLKTGEVVEVPPGRTMPPETGYTPFWEKHRGLLYVPDAEVPGVDLSVGSFVKFHLRTAISPSGGPNLEVAFDIRNF